jgi:hypothetical protein
MWDIGGMTDVGKTACCHFVNHMDCSGVVPGPMDELDKLSYATFFGG